jgi:hypothetical protein
MLHRVTGVSHKSDEYLCNIPASASLQSGAGGLVHADRTNIILNEWKITSFSRIVKFIFGSLDSVLRPRPVLALLRLSRYD